MIWKNKLPSKVRVYDNTKLYYRKYGHVLTIYRQTNWRDQVDHTKWRNTMHNIRTCIESNLADGDYSIRMEWCTLRIFTNEVDKVLSVLPKDVIRKYLESIGIMRDDVRASLVQKPGTYKSIYTVAKKLPFDQYRYKIHYVSDSRQKRAIGKDALEAISQQISQTPGVKWTIKHDNNCSSLGHNWNATYFYSTDLDWMPMVMLIDSRFIKKIEYIKLESEIEQ